MKIEIDVDIPEGFEATGEYRQAIEGEWYSAINLSQAFHWTLQQPTDGRFIILRRKKKRPVVITYRPVERFADATVCPDDPLMRCGILLKPTAHPDWWSPSNVDIQWLSSEEREESI